MTSRESLERIIVLSRRVETPAGAEKYHKPIGTILGLSDAQYGDHVRRVVKILGRENVQAQNTTLVHGLKDKNGHLLDRQYTPARTALHNQIILDVLKQHSAIPRDHRAVMSGGLPGSGKGHVLANHAGFPKNQFMAIDPDEMKKELIKRGLAPKIKGLSPLETAALIHEESSHLAKRLANVATRRGINVIIDGTMADEAKTTKTAQTLKDRGYDVQGVFVHVPLAVSKQSALNRHRHGLENARSGKDSMGGRLVPEDYIEGSRAPEGSEHEAKNENTFHALRRKGIFSRTQAFDNSRLLEGVAPKLISESGKPRPENPTAGMSKSQQKAFVRFRQRGMTVDRAKSAASRLP